MMMRGMQATELVAAKTHASETCENWESEAIIPGFAAGTLTRSSTHVSPEPPANLLL